MANKLKPALFLEGECNPARVGRQELGGIVCQQGFPALYEEAGGVPIMGDDFTVTTSGAQAVHTITTGRAYVKNESATGPLEMFFISSDTNEDIDFIRDLEPEIGQSTLILCLEVVANDGLPFDQGWQFVGTPDRPSENPGNYVGRSLLEIAEFQMPDPMHPERWSFVSDLRQARTLCGLVGAPGRDNNMQVGSVITSDPGGNAEVDIHGDPPNQIIDFVLPRGEIGPANVLKVGTVSTLSVGENATASITGSYPDQTLNLGLPRGEIGPANSLSVGSVTASAPDSDPQVTITGTAPSQTVDFVLPRGQQGPEGSSGAYMWEVIPGTDKEMGPGQTLSLSQFMSDNYDAVLFAVEIITEGQTGSDFPIPANGSIYPRPGIGARRYAHIMTPEQVTAMAPFTISSLATLRAYQSSGSGSVSIPTKRPANTYRIYTVESASSFIVPVQSDMLITDSTLEFPIPTLGPDEGTLITHLAPAFKASGAKGPDNGQWLVQGGGDPAPPIFSEVSDFDSQLSAILTMWGCGGDSGGYQITFQSSGLERIAQGDTGGTANWRALALKKVA